MESEQAAGSPQAIDSPQGETIPHPQGREQITFRFCSECSNMLYPREDEVNARLIYTCRTCQYIEPALTSCVFRNELDTSVGETAGVTQDVGADPTVGASCSRLPVEHMFCLLCGCSISCLVCGALINPDTSASHVDSHRTQHSDQVSELSSSCESYFSSNMDAEHCYMSDSFLDDDDMTMIEAKNERQQQQQQQHNLPRSNEICPACGNNEAVYFQSQQRGSNTAMTLFYVCCDCGYIYKDSRLRQK